MPVDKGPFKRGQTSSPRGRNRNSEQLLGPEAHPPYPQPYHSNQLAWPDPIYNLCPIAHLLENTALDCMFEPAEYFVYIHTVLLGGGGGMGMYPDPWSLKLCPTSRW